MASINVRHVGNYIRDQRRAAQISVRELAKSAGVSNPYLSQIERGLRRPSAEILQQIAKGLRISAEALYVQAGILDERDVTSDVPGAVLADPHINERQKRVLLDIYDSFLKENSARAAAEAEMPAATAQTISAALAGAAEPAAPRATKQTGTRVATRQPVTTKTASKKTASKKTATKKAVSKKAAVKKAGTKKTTT